MHISAFSRILVPLALVIASLVLLSLASSDSTSASHTPERTFAPSYDVLLCNDLPANFSGPAAILGPCSPDDRSAALGSHPDLTTVTNWGRGNMNYAQDTLITTTSPEWDIAQGTLEEGTSTIPEGQVMGGLISTTTLGLAANPCNNIITPNFIFWNASTDGAGDVVVAQPEGTADRWSTIISDGGDSFAGQGDADSLIVTKYPDFLLRMFDPDGNGLFDSGSGGYDPVLPWARYAGGTQVPPGGDWQALQVLVFAPGQLQAEFFANPDNSTHPYTRLDPELGWTSITVLNDPSAVALPVSAISDFCTELAPPLMLLGNPGGNARLTAPSITTPGAGAGVDDEGTYVNRLYTLSQRDTDGDGIENGFDTCPLNANIDDPYDEGGGANPGAGGDLDMIDPACDPTPNDPTKYDPTNAEDGAGPNTCGDTIDNGGGDGADMLDPDCHDPSVSGDIDGDTYSNSQDNCPLIANFPNVSSETGGAYNVVASDGGPKGDAIGDPCDSTDSDSTPSTDGEQNFLFFTASAPVCIRDDHATADGDNDGVCDAGALGTQDGDNDGFTDTVELYMSTDPLADCSAGAKHQAWPLDFNNDKVVNILDIVQLTPPTFGAVKGVDPEYRNRLDLNGDTTVNILDIVQLTPPVFGNQCKSLIEICRYVVEGDGAQHKLDVKGCSGAAANSATKPNVTLTMATLCDPGAKEKVKVFARIGKDIADGDSVTDATSKCDAGPTTSVGPLPTAGGKKSANSSSGQEPGTGDFTCSSLATDLGAGAHAFDIKYTVVCKLYAE